ncbi:MAG: ATP synthase subunit I [Bryobacterales bacterium]|nr:ATP synthase subunit I [Bryobacteraceae bacterium]MDW8129261.1 ATP synthase subunit I [Bryobacterales bacterium]
MSEADAARIEQALGRIRRLMAALAIAGTAVAFLVGGLRWGAGFLAGALAAMVNFRWIEQIAAGLGPGRGGRRMRWAVLFGMRYVLLGGVAYAIVKLFGISGLAILAGLLVAAAAVLAEMLYELLHAGT